MLESHLIFSAVRLIELFHTSKVIEYHCIAYVVLRLLPRELVGSPLSCQVMQTHHALPDILVWRLDHLVSQCGRFSCLAFDP